MIEIHFLKKQNMGRFLLLHMYEKEWSLLKLDELVEPVFPAVAGLLCSLCRELN